jgi:hypothetical protein
LEAHDPLDSQGSEVVTPSRVDGHAQPINAASAFVCALAKSQMPILSGRGAGVSFGATMALDNPGHSASVGVLPATVDIYIMTYI